jgi:hypothetical protein
MKKINRKEKLTSGDSDHFHFHCNRLETNKKSYKIRDEKPTLHFIPILFANGVVCSSASLIEELHSLFAYMTTSEIEISFV